ncbi:pitrilysin family protein [Hathewaya histolytica]|uniref:Zinc protease n=1 Tax=Hathewaya histolytica TaxID=1498 RepID=A0A4U9R7H4_HATHI|nr:pitrilysin family protein [Hathewaya histolytica]VTQ87425.1 zinc protease [Hathewaya histolytica]
MKRVIFKNGLRFIYKHVENNLTSFAVSFEAGANVEINEKEYGIAHVAEHMVYKGTKNYTEEEINKKLDELFGFNNAMTNYPYVVYYGTLLSQDFAEGFELYSDIILNPTFPNKGFKEEIDVICEELKEWKEDTHQFCEDELLYNSFDRRRIKERIIGKEDILKTITLNQVKDFYNKFYRADNCVISVVSSLEFERVFDIINSIYGNWYNVLEEKSKCIEEKNIYENNNEGIYVKNIDGLEGAKVQILFPIDSLSDDEVKALRIFNVAFGEGTSGILYDEIRTKNALAYEVGTTIKNEKGIKVYKIFLGTSKSKTMQSISIIKNKIEEIKQNKGFFTKEKVDTLIKSLELKRAIALEKSIQQSVSLSVYEIMYGECGEKLIDREYILENSYNSPLYLELRNLKEIDEDMILKVINKVFQNDTIQILA